MARFTLHGVAPNRTGIVAAVAQSLADVGCNLEVARMSLLHGQFSIVLVLEAPGLLSGTVIEEALAPLLEEFALQLFVRPVSEDADEPGQEDLVFILVHGADRSGTVARVAHVIAAAGGNIVELAGHVVIEGATTPSRLELTAELRSPARAGLRANLEILADELGMRCDIRENGARDTSRGGEQTD